METGTKMKNEEKEVLQAELGSLKPDAAVYQKKTSSNIFFRTDRNSISKGIDKEVAADKERK